MTSSPKPTEALQNLRDLWREEQRATHERFAHERQTMTLQQRVEQGLALSSLSLDDIDSAPAGRTLLWLSPNSPNTDLDDLRIGPGDPVRLWWDDPESDTAILAVVARKRSNKLAVMIDGDPPERLEEGSFNLDRDEPQTTFKRGLHAIRTFLDAPPRSALERTRNLLFSNASPTLLDPLPTPISPFNTHLNPTQLHAVELALRAQEMAFIHGPPGTGKTTTLVEVIRQHIALDARVLVTCESNTATDNIALKLAEAGVHVVRMGHPARILDSLLPHTLDARLEATPTYAATRSWKHEAADIRRRAHRRFDRGSISRSERRAMLREANALMRDARKQLDNERRAILHRASVICCTASSAHHPLLDSLTFDCVVLDEATQATDPIALLPLTRAPKAIFAGDPHQLPPTVISLKASRAGLSSTFFERLIPHNPHVTHMLTVQYRMHADIMTFPSESKYDGQLTAHPSVASHTLDDLPHILPDPLRSAPLILIDTAGKGWDEVRDEVTLSTSNPEHAQRIEREARRLISRGVPAHSIAVITPYHAQTRILRDSMRDLTQHGLEISTIDGFQGREQEVILLDLVRSNPDAAIGFLGDTRRMNVALTRARRLLLVLGDSATLSNHPYYRSFFDTVEILGQWTSAYNDDAPPLENTP